MEPRRGQTHAYNTGFVSACQAEPRPDSAMLIDATMKGDMPPVALPKREFMEGAKALWEQLGLPALRPEQPWHGYSLGDWTEEWDRNAMAATRGEWMDRSESLRQRRRSGSDPSSGWGGTGPSSGQSRNKG